mmetsp:Transcript_29184/g.32411  ORF Transcript_29184/g.32411 Transcript_29184/m.32411 type:complete len:108 (-) Transcript_29184:106-429(-)
MTPENPKNILSKERWTRLKEEYLEQTGRSFKRKHKGQKGKNSSLPQVYSGTTSSVKEGGPTKKRKVNQNGTEKNEKKHSGDTEENNEKSQTTQHVFFADSDDDDVEM